MSRNELEEWLHVIDHVSDRVVTVGNVSLFDQLEVVDAQIGYPFLDVELLL